MNKSAILWSLCLSALALSWGAQAEPLTAAPCYLDGLPDRAECFQLPVPENPAEPGGAKLTLHAARLPALTPSNLPPLAILAGGPGQSAIEIGGAVGQAFQALRAERDIVLLEQRGTGKSNGLNCVPADADPYRELFNAEQYAQQIADCLAPFTGDLRHYNTPNSVDDFAAMVRALGYAQVHLYGASYGSRAALVFLRRHPELIASAVVDGLAPVQSIVGLFAMHGHRALNLLFDDCEQTPACAAQFPHLRSHYWRLWDDLSERAQPLAQPIRHPKTLAAHTLRLDRIKFFQLTLSNLYAPEQRQLLPYAIDQAARGNWHPFAGIIAASSDPGLYSGLTTNILCNEDMRRASPADLSADGQSPFKDTAVALMQSLCAPWPVEYQLPAAHFAAVQSDIPVLALSGKLDPVTPPAWGELATQGLRNATHLVADKAAHIVAMRGCGPKLVRHFINDPSAPLEAVDCLAELPDAVFMRSVNAH